MVETRGLTIVYTGDGKGKTTAALGLGLRAVGHSMKVFMLQFMKGQGQTGELQSVQELAGFEIEQAGRTNFVSIDAPDPMDVEAAQKGLERASEVIMSGDYDVVILDEVNMAVYFGLVKEERVLDLIDSKPAHVHLVLTGRSASERIIERADLVSEVREIKHPFRQGVAAQKGIEY